MSNVHINTDLRVAFHDSLVKTLQENSGQTTPYKFFAPSFNVVREVVEKNCNFSARPTSYRSARRKELVILNLTLLCGKNTMSQEA